MGQILKTAPAAEPVTLAEAKLHCKVDGTDDDALITALIISARQQAEHRTGRALITQQWEFTLDKFPQQIELPKPALVSVQSVKYLDSALSCIADAIALSGGSVVDVATARAAAIQTLPSTEYQVITSELVGRIIPAYGKDWPGCRVQPDSVVVAFTAGYGDAAAVPTSIKSWMLMAIGTMYGQREGIIIDAKVSEVPRDYCAGLLDPYWVPGV